MGIMEIPKGFCASLKSFLYFLPFFLGLLFLGIIKGLIFCLPVWVIMAIGNSAVIIGLWPAHVVWTYYCIARAKQLGPLLKIALCICVSVLLVLWPIVGIAGSILVGAGYGLLRPLICTFEAVGEGKIDQFYHCVVDGTWSTITGCFIIVRDFTDVCFFSYFFIMDDLSHQEPPSGIRHEIRLFRLIGCIIIGLLGILVDMPLVLLIALYKSPYMLFKGWHRLVHDLIGREGPFLETACVPFAGLAILLWPSVVIGAILSSIFFSFFLGLFAAVVTYQESSACFGLAYIMSAISLYDEYTNDVLDMREGSCFPRPQYRKKKPSLSGSLSRPASFMKEKPEGRGPPLRAQSFRDSMVELKPLEVLDHIFVECKRHGENLALGGPITMKDIEQWRSNNGGNRILSIGLPAYCIFQGLLRSAKANSPGFLLSDKTEITTTNKPREKLFDWFFDPLMIIKEQIKAQRLSEAEEDYLNKLVLFGGESERMKDWNIGSPPESEIKRAEIEALARRLRGISKSISRFPTFRRRFENLVNSLAEEIETRNERSVSSSRSRSIVRRLSSLKSFGSRKLGPSKEEEAQHVVNSSEIV
ncbi:hypothetical protein AMTRI_Chr06g199960 [Amborella trichopoda]